MYDTPGLDWLKEFFPTKSVRLSNKVRKWINSNLKTLDRAKKQEWCKRGKSEKYVKLKAEFDQKYMDAANNYLDEKVKELKESDPK